MTSSSALRVCCLALMVLVGAPSVAYSQPAGPNRQLLTSGLITTGLAYTPALIVAVNSERKEDKLLYYPVAGPWLNLANRKEAGDSRFNRALLVIDGIAQGIGVLQVAASFMFISTGEHSANSSGIKARVVPSRFGSNGYGLAALGQFW